MLPTAQITGRASSWLWFTSVIPDVRLEALQRCVGTKDKEWKAKIKTVQKTYQVIHFNVRTEIAGYEDPCDGSVLKGKRGYGTWLDRRGAAQSSYLALP